MTTKCRVCDKSEKSHARTYGHIRDMWGPMEADEWAKKHAFVCTGCGEADCECYPTDTPMFDEYYGG